MRVFPRMLALFLLGTAGIDGQESGRQAYLGYAFPAGGSIGQTFELMLGGRYLTGPQQVLICGDEIGVEIGLEIGKHYRIPPRLTGSQLALVRMRIAQREEELSGRPIPIPVRNAYERLIEIEIERESERMSQNPLFEDIGSMDEVDIGHLKGVIAEFNSRQPNDQISEQVKVKVSIPEDARPGMRELRLVSRSGLSNPIRFQISQSSEDREREPNDGIDADSGSPVIESLPRVINGQIMPGDIDRFILQANRGQTVYFDLFARRLIPYLADAVPGWFQATLAIYDAAGARLAYVDDSHGDPDPSFSYTFAEPGNYVVEIRDAIYRGGENFVYRLHLSEWPIPENKLRSPDVDYRAIELEYTREAEPNGRLQDAQEISLPRVVVGTIQTPGDVDLFRFSVQKGETVTARIEARKFGSPLDSLLRLVNAQGEILAVNDDYMEKRDHLHIGPGLMTHFADSYLSYTFSEAGVYTIAVEDAQGRGSNEHQYRLRLSAPMPDFKARVSPSSLNVGPTGCAGIHIHLQRTDGFTGEVGLRLVDAPEGVRLHHAIVPEGHDEHWATLEWPREEAFSARSLRLEAVARIGENEIVHPVVPCDDTMQAFLWRHLLPAQNLWLSLTTGYRVFLYPPGHPSAPVDLRAGTGVEYMQPLVNPVRNGEQFEFRLREGPAGVRLTGGILDGPEIRLTFLYEGEPAENATGNLLVEVIRNFQQKGESRSAWLGVLPAIPYQIAKP